MRTCLPFPSLVGVASWLVMIGSAIAATQGADPIPPASQRFAEAGGTETPDFQRHLMPMLGRLGCNGRACHGSFQGRGGVRLSLFGYDPKMDHESLTKVPGSSGDVLVNFEKPDESPMIAFPIDPDMHEGGKRFERGSWQHHVFAAWIRGGAKPIERTRKLTRLEVRPAEIVAQATKVVTDLQVIAHWEDGVVEDVTCLSRFQTNNEAVVEVDENGRATVVGAGDTHVVAFYDNGVTPVPVILPVSDQAGDRYPPVATRTRVDELVVNKLRKLGIVPADVCGDDEFLRRVSLDLIGTLPTAAEVETFLADTAADKRTRKINELLERPEYSAWWATKFCDLTGNNPRNLSENNFRAEQSRQWYEWMHRRLRENTSYDQIVAGLLLAAGRKEGDSYDEYVTEMSSYFRRRDPADFSQRDTLPHYWSRTNFRTPEDRVVGVSYAFLGLRIQCAQCHKHPFDQWTKTDFEQFTGFFKQVQYGIARDARDEYDQMMVKLDLKDKNGAEQRKKLAELASQGEKIPLREVYVTPVPQGGGGKKKKEKSKEKGSAPNPQTTARLLGGEPFDLASCDDPRQVVMDWLRQPSNPFFARAIVNRMWAHYLGVGIIEPADDLNLANPPSNRELLDHLSAGFIEHGFDLKWLHREICGSDAYQRGWRPNATNQLDHRNFSRAWPRRMPAEVAYDAVVQATASADKLAKLAANPTSRAIGHASVTSGANAYAMRVFGKPERTTTCDCERSNEPTLLQSVYLLNDQDLLGAIDQGGWATEAARRLGEGRGAGKKKGVSPEELNAATDQVIREVYLRTVSRLPRDEEMRQCREHLASAGSKTEGLRDLMWAMLNTKEFVVNH